jgi:hypothetical protein
MKPIPKKMTCAQAGKLGGQTGGKSTSPAKIKAARENAKKGGRPPKKSTVKGTLRAMKTIVDHFTPPGYTRLPD